MKKRKKNSRLTENMISISSIFPCCSIKRMLALVCSCCVMVFWGYSSVCAKPVPVSKSNSSSAKEAGCLPESVVELEKMLSGSSNTFVYKREGRLDPFMPFISEQIVQTEMVFEEEELTGMRQYEPGQLTLVALIFAEEGPLAMVQDSVGMGYVLRKGTKIGRSGIVDRITANMVIIKQSFQSTSGKTRHHTVQMVLKKDGEM